MFIPLLYLTPRSPNFVTPIISEQTTTMTLVLIDECTATLTLVCQTDGIIGIDMALSLRTRYKNSSAIMLMGPDSNTCRVSIR